MTSLIQFLSDKSRLFSKSVVILSTGFLVSCASSPEPPPVAEADLLSSQNSEVIQAMSQLSALNEELKQLRNAIEEMQFESQNAKRRQQNFYEDVDRRLLGLERHQKQSMMANGAAQVQEDVNNEFQPVDELMNESSTGGTVSGQVDVVVVSDSTQSSSVSNTSTEVSSASVVQSGTVSVAEQNTYDQAFEMLKKSRYEDAINQFQYLADTWPNSSLADDAYYWMSEAHYVNREFETALSGFRNIVLRYPSSQRVPEALLKIGYIQYDVGAYEDAAETFREILDRFPGHQVTVSAQTRLQRIEQTIQ